MCHRIVAGVAFCRLMGASLALLGSCGGALGQEDISRAAVLAHLDQLQNLTMKCHLDTVHNAPSGAAVADGDETYDFAFSFLNGSARLDTATAHETLADLQSKEAPGFAWQTSTISATGKMEWLADQVDSKGNHRPVGGISQIDAFPEQWTVDIGLGLRLYRGLHWLTKRDLAAGKEIPGENSDLFIIQIPGDNGMLHEMRFSKKLFYALVYYRCTFPSGSFEDVMNSDFQQIGNVFLPRRIVRQGNLVDQRSGKLIHPLVHTVTGVRL